MPRRRDDKTGDLFAMPAQPKMLPGSQNIGMEIRHLLSDILKQSPKSRYEIAARMSELLGADISKHQLDSWTADSRDGWRFPLEYLPAFETACDTHDLTHFIADARGCTLNIGEESLTAKLGQLELMRTEIAKQIKDLRDHLGRSHA